MKRYLLLLVFLTLLRPGFAQYNIELRAISTDVFDLLPSLDLSLVNLIISTEIGITPRISLLFGIGGVISSNAHFGVHSIENKGSDGLKIQFESRQYFGRTKKVGGSGLILPLQFFQRKTKALPHAGYYWGLQSSFQHTITKMSEDLFHQNGDRYHHIYDVYRQAFRFHLKIGYQCIKKSNLLIDQAFGLGFQYIASTSNQLRPFLPNDYIETEINGKPFNDGAGFYLSVHYQFKIGFNLASQSPALEN